LEGAGLRTHLYRAVGMDEVYLLVGASEARLLREADRVDYQLELDKSRCVEGGLRLGMRLPILADQRGLLNREFDIRTWGRIYGKYDGYAHGDANTFAMACIA
jgi:hypothetical protein